MVNLENFITSFPWPTWLLAAWGVAMALGVLHWFPWSFVIGHCLTRYTAFLSGCIAITVSFGLWALAEGLLIPWLMFTAVIALLHWPLWLFEPMHKVNYILTYVLATLPVLIVYSLWAAWAGAQAAVALIGVCGLYAAGGLATWGFNLADKIGNSEHFERLGKH